MNLRTVVRTFLLFLFAGHAHAGLWLKQNLAEQVRSSEGVLRCGETLLDTPEAFRLVDPESISLVSLDDMSEASLPKKKVFEKVEIEGDSLAGTYRVHRSVKQARFVRSDLAEIQRALTQKAQCLEDLIAQDSAGRPPRNSIDAENRALLIKNQLAQAIASSYASYRPPLKALTIAAAFAGGGYMGTYLLNAFRSPLVKNQVAYLKVHQAAKKVGMFKGTPAASVLAETILSWQNQLRAEFAVSLRRMAAGIAVIIALAYGAIQLEKVLLTSKAEALIWRDRELAYMITLDDADFRVYVAENPEVVDTLLKVREQISQDD